MRKNFIIFGTGKHALLVLNEITTEYITDQIFFLMIKKKKICLKLETKNILYLKVFQKLNKKMKKKFIFFHCCWIKFFEKKNIR